MARDPFKNDAIADDVYGQFVGSLFSNGHILVIGGFAYLVIAVSVYIKTSVTAFLMMAPVLLAANIWRYLGIRAFHRAGGIIKNIQDARKWESDYILRGSAQGLAVGAFGFLSIYVYPDGYAELASVSMATGSLVTVASRNYGSRDMVKILTLSFIVPLVLAFLLRAEIFYAVVALMLLPLVVITISSAGYVRKVLFSAVTGRKLADELARRFDRALNTMPQGLLMLDRVGRVTVANREAAELFGLGTPGAVSGRHLSALMGRGAAAGLIERNACNDATTRLTVGLRNGANQKFIIPLLDGRSFELTTREGDNDLGVVMFEDVTQRARASERISVMARFDSLTELPNRAHFLELVAERLSNGNPARKCALAIFDLDDFKGINDSLGHPFGDKLIQTIGHRLGIYASDDQIVGRLGGDEFVIYFDAVANEEALTALLNSVRATVAEQMDISGNRTRIEASGGAVMMVAGQASVDVLTVRADLALHTSKSRSRNNWSLFEEGMEQSFRMREILKADLRKAINERALRVVYQPIVRLDTMRIATCEALCRWHHPELGQISPAVFIPLAEETGLIADITTFVLEQACADSLKWSAQIGVSVNLSAKDLADFSIVAKVASALKSSGLPPKRLEVEMTETSLLDDKSAARAHAEEIRSLGVTVALDDFGTGYSSLSYIHKLPLDKIKIDRSFVMDMTVDERSRQLIKSIVQLSHQLGIAVTVEGVETFEQLKLLTNEVHPDLVQGFLFGSALTASGIETMSHTGWQFGHDAKKVVGTSQRRRRAASTT